MARYILIAILLLAAALQGAAAQEDPDPPLGAHGLRLPASFAGTLPCADCAGVRHHLDLWPGQAYRLRRDWLGAAAPLVRAETGRWSADPELDALVLHGPGGTVTRWHIAGPDRLRLLAADGSPIRSDLPYDLVAGQVFAPAEVSLRLSGRFTYFADAARFEDCASGQVFPVATEGDYLALERAYLQARAAPQAPVLAEIAATLAERPGMEGPPRQTVIVDRLVGVISGGDCAPRRAAAPGLTGVYWLLAQLRGVPVEAMPGRIQPHLVLRADADGAGPGFAARVGCNRMAGGYDRDGSTGLSFGPVIATLMACPPPLDALESDLAAVLAATRGFAIAGGTLHLRDGDGGGLARLEAAYQP